MEKAVTIKDFETISSSNLPKMSYDYYRAGANGQYSLNDGVEKFKEIMIKQSAFSDPSQFKSLETTILGYKV